MRLQDRQIARIAFFATRPLTATVYTRMSAAGPQHVTAVFAQYGDMGGRMFMSSAARARAAPRYILAQFALQCKNCGKKAGLEAIDTRVIRISVAFADFEDFWNSNTVPVLSLIHISEPTRL